LYAFYLSEYCSIKLNFTSHSSHAHPVVMCWMGCILWKI
jgi:hypothetical protein